MTRLLWILAAGGLLWVAGCSGAERLGVQQRQYYSEAAQLTGGDPHRGRDALRNYGCAACHSIPGIPGADGLVGPPLDRIASRVYLAGRLTNTPENMIQWVRHPRQVDEQTAMPDTGVTEQDARDITAYLYTLR